MNQHTIIVTHGNCPDGAAASTVAKKVYTQTEVVRGLHEKIDDQVLKAAKRLDKNGQLWIADICCSEKTLVKVCEYLAAKKAKLGIYEHHITRRYLETFNFPEGLEGEIRFDLNRCGSMIFYEAMAERHVDKLRSLKDFIRLINDRDLWKNEDALSAELSSLHAIYGDDKFAQRFVKNPIVEFTEHEKVLLNYEKEQLLKRMHRLMSNIEIKKDENGLRYGIMIGEGKASEVCNAAIHKFNLEYVCLVDYNGKRVSIRSYKEFDCAQFSKDRGGGGHPRAAGFPIDRKNFKLYNEV